MITFELAIVIAVMICGIAAIVLSVLSIIKRRERRSASKFLMASQVFLCQLVTLMAVMQKSWIYLGIAILCDAMLAASIILRDDSKKALKD